jgi:hypothetical protein
MSEIFGSLTYVDSKTPFSDISSYSDITILIFGRSETSKLGA